MNARAEVKAPVRRVQGRITKADRVLALADGRLSHAQIAAKVGITVDAVRSHLRRLREQGIGAVGAPRGRPRGAAFAAVMDLCDGRHTISQIAAQLGLSESYARNLAAEVCRTSPGARVKPARGGSVDILDGLDAPVAAWLQAEVPDGATVEDVIRAIIVDAYFDAACDGVGVA